MRIKAVSQYLERHAEPEARQCQWQGAPAQHVVCIPACREDGSLIQTLQSLSQAEEADNSVAIVVVNGGELADESIHESNALSWRELEQLAQLESGYMAWGCLGGMRVLAVDRFSENRRLPAKQGVGLARKIAGDLALRFVSEGKVQGDWILCTDADVSVPADYFLRASGETSAAAALLYPFTHEPEGDVLQAQAMALYEGFLHYYVSGLRYAKSPYAFHTIGSLIGVRATAYAAVRGFPKRQAGEDFYLLNKLAKVGEVVQLGGTPVRIRGRESARVPFGTGAAVTKIRQLLVENKPYLVMAPRGFEGLRIWLEALGEFGQTRDLEALNLRLRESDLPLIEVLSELGALRAAEAAAAQVTGAQLSRRLVEWNDAFRTLKILHGLRDRATGEWALAEAEAGLAQMQAVLNS